MIGPLKGPIQDNFSRILFGNLRTIWTHMGPYEGEALQEKRTLSFSNTFLGKIIVFDLHIAFFDSVNVFFMFLAEICFRTIMKLLQKASLGTKARSFGTSITLP